MNARRENATGSCSSGVWRCSIPLRRRWPNRAPISSPWTSKVCAGASPSRSAFCGQIRALDHDITQAQIRCARLAGVPCASGEIRWPIPETRSRPWRQRSTQALRRVAAAQTRLQRLNDAHQALLRRSRPHGARAAQSVPVARAHLRRAGRPRHRAPSARKGSSPWVPWEPV